MYNISDDEEYQEIEWTDFKPWETRSPKKGQNEQDEELKSNESLEQIYCPLNEEELNAIKSPLFKHIKYESYLGAGAFGQVCEMTAFYRPYTQIPWDWLKQRERFAVKFIWHPDSLPLKTVRELQILPIIRHENICNLAQYLVVPHLYKHNKHIVCMFLEFCHGDLRKLIDEVGHPRYISENLSSHWFAQMARALEYLNGMNIAHLDIKEDNILYKSYENPSNTFERRFLSSNFKLADFGVSQTIEYPDLEDSKKKDIYLLFETLTRSAIPSIGGWPFTLEAFIIYCQTCEWDDLDNYEMPPQWQQLSSAFKDLCCRMYSVFDSIGTPYKVLTATDILNHSWLQNKWRIGRRRRDQTF